MKSNLAGISNDSFIGRCRNSLDSDAVI